MRAATKISVDQTAVIQILVLSHLQPNSYSVETVLVITYFYYSIQEIVEDVIKDEAIKFGAGN